MINNYFQNILRNDPNVLTIDIISKHFKNESFGNINSEKSKNLFKIMEAPSSEFKFPRPNF